MTCNDCLYYEACTGWVEPDDLMKHNKPETCESFEYKTNYAEVVRCKDCKHRRESAVGIYCLPVFGLKRITDLNAFCSYGERR